MVLLIFFFCPCTTLEFCFFVQRIFVVVLLDLVGKEYALVKVTISFVPATVLLISFRLLFVSHYLDPVLCSHSQMPALVFFLVLLRSLLFHSF